MYLAKDSKPHKRKWYTKCNMFEKFTTTTNKNPEDITTPSQLFRKFTEGAQGTNSETLSALLELPDTHRVLIDMDFFNHYNEPYNTLAFGETYDAQGAPALIREYGALSPSDVQSRQQIAAILRQIIK